CFFTLPHPPRSTPFPYTTLFRSLKEVFAFAARSGERMPPELVAWLFSQLAEALSYLHGLGVVHEDLRPEKILLGYQDEVKLTDLDRKSTRLNSSHVKISYAVFCL